MDEVIVISPPGQPRIRVIVVDMYGGKVRLGVEADISVEVHRQEVQDAIDAEKAGVPPPPRSKVVRCAACNRMEHKCACPVPGDVP